MALPCDATVPSLHVRTRACGTHRRGRRCRDCRGCVVARVRARLWMGVRDRRERKGRAAHLSVRSRLRDLLHHPLEGFGHLRSPWDDRAYDADTPAHRRRLAPAVPQPYRPNTMASALNRMIDDVSSGEPVSNVVNGLRAEAGALCYLAVTGSVLLPREARRPFMGDLPGGRLLLCRQRTPRASRTPWAISAAWKSYNAFVLRYRVGLTLTISATQDLAAARSRTSSRTLERSASAPPTTRFLLQGSVGTRTASRDWFARRGPVWPLHGAETGCRRDGVHGALGPLIPWSRPRLWSSARKTALLLHPS